MATGIKLNSTHQRDTNKNPSELSSPQPERLLSKQEKVSAGEREALHSCYARQWKALRKVRIELE